jgi:hypothetical protein
MAIIKGFPNSDELFPQKHTKQHHDENTILELTHELVEEHLEKAKTVYLWDYCIAGRTAIEKSESLILTMTQVANTICRSGGWGYFWTVVPIEIFQLVDHVSNLQRYPIIQLSPEQSSLYIPMGISKVENVGIFCRRWRMYCDQYMSSRILVGVGPLCDLPERYGRITISNMI